MKKFIKLGLAILLLVSLVGCGGASDDNNVEVETTTNEINITNKNFINVYEENGKHSSIKFNEDNSFNILEYSLGNEVAIKGSYVIKDDVLSLSVLSSEQGNLNKLEFKIISEDLLVLQANILTSYAGNSYVACQSVDDLIDAIDEQRAHTKELFADKVFYNETLRNGAKETTSIKFNSDGSFEMSEYNLIDKVAIKGKWEVGEYKIKCSVSECEVGDFASIDFYIEDFERLILENNLFNSLEEDKFTSQKKNYSSVEEVSETNKIYVNASQKERGEFGSSSLELRNDQTFSLTDVVGMGATLVEGNYGRQEDVLMFSYDDEIYDASGNKVLNFEFRYVDANTLELMRDLQGSKAGDCFSVDGKIPSDFVSIYKNEEIACTELKCKYKSYWAIANPANVYTLDIEVLPEGCTDVLSFTSDDETIAKVDQQGNVTPGNVGNTVIHVTCGKQKLDINVESRPKSVKLENIEMNYIVIDVGGKDTIKPIFYPENATDKSLSFVSADSSRVSVNTNGDVVGLKPGPCEIYVTASNGNTYTCTVLVRGEFLDISLPLYSELSYSAGNYAPCYVWIRSYDDGEEHLTDVSHEAELHSEGGEVELVGDMLFAHSDPGETKETNVWFTYKGYTSNKVTIYVKP